MPRSPISDSIKRVNEAIAYLQNTLNPGEIDLLLDELAPLPELEQATKKTRKKASKKVSSKSSRASGMAAAINRSLTQQQRVTVGSPCAYRVNKNGNETECGEVESNAIHDSTMGYAGYHEFQPAAPNLLTEEESQMVIGAIPLQAL